MLLRGSERRLVDALVPGSWWGDDVVYALAAYPAGVTLERSAARQRLGLGLSPCRRRPGPRTRRGLSSFMLAWCVLGDFIWD